MQAVPYPYVGTPQYPGPVGTTQLLHNVAAPQVQGPSSSSVRYAPLRAAPQMSGPIVAPTGGSFVRNLLGRAMNPWAAAAMAVPAVVDAYGAAQGDVGGADPYSSGMSDEELATPVGALGLSMQRPMAGAYPETAGMRYPQPQMASQRPAVPQVQQRPGTPPHAQYAPSAQYAPPMGMQEGPHAGIDDATRASAMKWLFEQQGM